MTFVKKAVLLASVAFALACVSSQEARGGTSGVLLSQMKPGDAVDSGGTPAKDKRPEDDAKGKRQDKTSGGGKGTGGQPSAGSPQGKQPSAGSGQGTTKQPSTGTGKTTGSQPSGGTTKQPSGSTSAGGSSQSKQPSTGNNKSTGSQGTTKQPSTGSQGTGSGHGTTKQPSGSTGKTTGSQGTTKQPSGGGGKSTGSQPSGGSNKGTGGQPGAGGGKGTGGQPSGGGSPQDRQRPGGRDSPPLGSRPDEPHGRDRPPRAHGYAGRGGRWENYLSLSLPVSITRRDYGGEGSFDGAGAGVGFSLHKVDTESCFAMLIRMGLTLTNGEFSGSFEDSFAGGQDVSLGDVSSVYSYFRFGIGGAIDAGGSGRLVLIPTAGVGVSYTTMSADVSVQQTYPMGVIEDSYEGTGGEVTADIFADVTALFMFTGSFGLSLSCELSVSPLGTGSFDDHSYTLHIPSVTLTPMASLCFLL